MTLRRYHAAVWDEPLVMEMGAPGRRGVVFDEPGEDVEPLVPAALRRATPPALPELSEPDVLRHYLHLSQETLGMMGVSLFGSPPSSSPAPRSRRFIRSRTTTRSRASSSSFTGSSSFSEASRGWTRSCSSRVAERTLRTRTP